MHFSCSTTSHNVLAGSAEWIKDGRLILSSKKGQIKTITKMLKVLLYTFLQPTSSLWFRSEVAMLWPGGRVHLISLFTWNGLAFKHSLQRWGQGAFLRLYQFLIQIWCAVRIITAEKHTCGPTFWPKPSPSEERKVVGTDRNNPEAPQESNLPKNSWNTRKSRVNYNESRVRPNWKGDVPPQEMELVLEACFTAGSKRLLTQCQDGKTTAFT